MFSCSSEQGLFFTVVLGFSRLRLLLSQSTGSSLSGFRSCGSQASLPLGKWSLPRLGVELMSLHWQTDCSPLVHQEMPAGCIHRPRNVLRKWGTLLSLIECMTEWDWEWGQSHPNCRSQKSRMTLIRKREEMGSRDAWGKTLPYRRRGQRAI